MRKMITLLAILSVITLTITGCADNKKKDDKGSSVMSITSVVTEDEKKESNVEENTSSEMDNIGTEVDNVGSDIENESIEIEENIKGSRASELGNIAMETVEWPAMMDITDAEMAEAFLGIDITMCEDYYFSNQMISAQLNEIIIAKPVEGKEEDIKAAFDKHFEYIKNEAAFYPAQEESAAGAVMGKTEDGYLYLIVHANGADVETALLNSK